MVEFLRGGWLLVGCERAADLGQHLGRGDGVGPPVGVGYQVGESLASVGVGDGAAQATPQPLDPVGVRVVGGGVDQDQLLAQLFQQPTQQPRPLGGVDAQVVQDHHGDPAAGLGAGHGAAQLGAQRCGAAAVGHGPVQVAVAPVDQPEAVLLGVGAWCLDPSLACSAGTGPDAGQGRVQGELDLVLQVQVGAAQQPQQAGQILGEQLVGQGGIGDQVAGGWRHR